MSIIKEVEYPIKSIEKQKTLASHKKVYLNVLNDESKQMYIIHRSLRQQLNNYRIRNAHTKTRTEVKGGGKKPWKQKGTGRARAGSNRSPLWKGGGVIFGPRKKTYKSKINKKEKQLAIQIIIYNKFSNTIIIDKLLSDINKPSTKNAITELKQLGIETNNKKKVLLVVKKKTKILHLSFKNIPNIEIIKANNLNVLSLLKADRILITVNALSIINKINN